MEKLEKNNKSVLNKQTLLLSLGAMGVVYGDLGTSPIYTLKECFHQGSILPATPENVMGVLSLIFWSLTMVVTFKYVTFIMKADNDGEGGIFALLALITKHQASKKILITLTALFGASLLYGDGIITPVISVLSALEGLEIATSSAKPFVIPLTCIILIGLFTAQRYGTSKIGKIFGPIMLVWFLSIGLLGLNYIIKYPLVLSAINPYYAFHFMLQNQLKGFIMLGAVVLCITGAEALYADMGHFGRKPIQLAWYYLILPCLLLNYFGQGAVLLEQPNLVTNPFYAIIPNFLIYPMIALSTVSTTIASQSLISGIFSLTRQAVQLGFFPRLQILHTSSKTEGQIYIPMINNVMMVACIIITLAFKESTNLAAAFGMAVTANMVLTSFVYFAILRHIWKWSLWKSVSLVSVFLIFDFTYFISNLFKFFEGAWLPLTIALGIFTIMTTWKKGRDYLKSIIDSKKMGFDTFFEDINLFKYQRVPGTAIFMSMSSDAVPPALLNNLKHNHIIHEEIIFLSIHNLNIPFVEKEEQIKIEPLENGFYRIIAEYGFMQTPDVSDIIEKLEQSNLNSYPESTSYYLGRETLLVTGNSGMMKWRKSLFSFMSKNAQSPTLYFNIPPERVIELGIQVKI